jgi:hypothetical protein
VVILASLSQMGACHGSNSSYLACDDAADHMHARGLFPNAIGIIRRSNYVLQ